MSTVIENAVAQAKAIKARKDYDTLPQDVKDWVETILEKYDSQQSEED